MKLSDYKKAYEEYSAKMSDVARQLAFAGIALVWLFKVESKPTARIPTELLVPTALIAAGLFFDLLQYLLGTLIWQRFHRKHEKLRKSIAQDDTIEAPWYYPIPIEVAFWLKICTIFLGLGWIACYAAKQWWL